MMATDREMARGWATDLRANGARWLGMKDVEAIAALLSRLAEETEWALMDSTNGEVYYPFGVDSTEARVKALAAGLNNCWKPAYRTMTKWEPVKEVE